jgi:hypothetical protein
MIEELRKLRRPETERYKQAINSGILRFKVLYNANPRQRLLIRLQKLRLLVS